MANAQDPTVAKQWDNETSLEESFEQFAKIADGLKVCLMGSFRNGVGVCPTHPRSTSRLD